MKLKQTNLEVVVGWDAGLTTYFAQVKPCGEVDTNQLHLWAGTSPGEIPNVEQLQNVLRNYIDIPLGIVECLERDKKTERFGSVLLDLLGPEEEQ